MTDNEIVGEQVKRWDSISQITYGKLFGNGEAIRELSAWLAIQDVLGLHKGIKSDEDDDFFSHCTCDEWDEYNNVYPCPTRQAITNRIGGK